MKVPQHGASVRVIEKIHHRAVATRDENSFILIQTGCDHIRNATWIFEPSQGIAEF